MPPLKCALNWLVNDTICREAHLKYHIKQLEYDLKIALTSQYNWIGQEADIQPVLQDLIQYCKNYLYLLNKELSLTKPLNTKIASNWQDCYQHITKVQSKLHKALSAQEKMIQLNLLIESYHQLILLLIQENTKTNPAVNHKLFDKIRLLLSAKKPDSWLHALACLANEHPDNKQNLKSEFSRFSAQQLKNLAEAFQQQAFLDAVQAVFFYKLYPQHLFANSIHPEKLISLKSRLCGFYEFIEFLHAELTYVLAKQGIMHLKDRLFHGDELPVGIEIEVNEAYSPIIQKLLKSLHSHVLDGKKEVLFKPIEDIFCAYKFWFNPDRLIDATMMLKQRMVQAGQVQDFYQGMLTLYKQLTTTECLDLYGYFANKSSCYLMRTLLSIQQKTFHDWLGQLTAMEKQAIKNVYEDLDSLMEALRCELAARNIATKSYKRHLGEKKISPGQRIRAAVLRILNLYSKKMEKKNPKIEQLFAQIEARTNSD